jgi:hypothetical protein
LNLADKVVLFGALAGCGGAGLRLGSTSPAHAPLELTELSGGKKVRRPPAASRMAIFGARNEKNRLGVLPRAAFESAPMKETVRDR